MILAPFKWIVALFFNWSLALFHDPGWAVVGMSVLLSLLLTPLYIWIERRKNSDKAKSAPMQAEIDKIEAVYSGRERFYYTREIQRRYHYSPWTAVIPTLGLLVQIPFLLAAYHYLSELPVFNGAAFWYIKDLSKPDTIATFAGLPINLLAILMTVINLVSGWRYAESGKPKERIQYMAVAAIFLFLLYSCAASVVLYWTLSNALSLVRSEIFFRKNGVATKRNEEGVNWSATCVYMDCLADVASAYAVAIAICIFMFHVEAPSEFKNVVFLWNVFSLLVVASTVMMAVSCKCRGRPFRVGGLVCVGMAVALLGIRLLAEYAELPVDQCPILKYLSRMCFPFCVLLASMSFFVSVVTDRRRISEAKRRVCENNVDMMIPTLAAACIGAQLAFCGPIVVFASFVEGVQGNAWLSLGCYALCGLVVLPLAIRILIGFARGAIREFLSMCVIFVFVVVFAYGNLFPSDYGVLFCGVYSKPENMSPQTGMILLECLVLVLVWQSLRFIGGWLFKNARMVKSCFVLVLITFVFRVCVALCKINGGPDIQSGQIGSSGPYFTFSSAGTNTVYLLLDSIVGQSFGKIMDSNPSIAREFDGFTWYPTTISSGTCTYPNMPAMWGGEEYFPHEVGEGRKLKDVYFEAFEKYKSAILALGYDFGCTKFYMTYGVSTNGISRMWSESAYTRGSADNVLVGGEDGFAVLKYNALLRAVPTVFRRWIYDGGKWHRKMLKHSPFSRNFDFMEDLSRRSAKVVGGGMYYHHIHAETTHAPYLTRINGEERSCGVIESFRWSLAETAKWLRWMKENGVYDNTRIVICSDHGVGWDDESLMDSRYSSHVSRMKEIGRGRNIYFSLLLVKDVGECGRLRVDTTTKTVSHAAYFALGNPRFSEPVNRVCPSPVVLNIPVGWREQNGFKPLFSFEITGDASDGNNWRPLKEEK